MGEVEKMGPLRGDGNIKKINQSKKERARREDGSPSWGRKQVNTPFYLHTDIGREDGSPSWGRKR